MAGTSRPILAWLSRRFRPFSVSPFYRSAVSALRLFSSVSCFPFAVLANAAFRPFETYVFHFAGLAKVLCTYWGLFPGARADAPTSAWVEAKRSNLRPSKKSCFGSAALHALVLLPPLILTVVLAATAAIAMPVAIAIATIHPSFFPFHCCHCCVSCVF